MPRVIYRKAALALTAAILTPVPTHAQTTDDASKIRSEIEQLDREVEQIGEIPDRDHAGLKRKVKSLEVLYRGYSFKGFSRRELQRLSREIARVKADVRAETSERKWYRL